MAVTLLDTFTGDGGVVVNRNADREHREVTYRLTHNLVTYQQTISVDPPCLIIYSRDNKNIYSLPLNLPSNSLLIDVIGNIS